MRAPSVDIQDGHPDDTAASAGGFEGPAVLVVDDDGRIVSVLQAPQPADDTGHLELIGRHIDDLWPAEPANQLAAHAKRSIRSRSVESNEVTLESGERHFDFVFIPSGPNRVTVVARDISRRKIAFDRLERLAYRDELTKLPNRQFLLEEVNRCMDELRLREGRAAIICIDIQSDYGRDLLPNTSRQDAIMAKLASRLVHELRGVNDLDVDDLERYSVAARIESSRLGVLLPRIESGEDAESVTRRLLDSLQQPIKTSSQRTNIRATAGIALFPQDGTDAETLLENAITALEDASNQANSPYKFHSGTVRLRALQRQDLELELRAALDNDDFSIEYLPVVDAVTRRIVSIEALLRWPQNFFGSQSIRKVISIAENTGLILPIGAWVLRKSSAALASIREAGWQDLRLSVNLSAQEFSRDNLADNTARILEESGLCPESLDIEITEYSLFRDAMRGYPRCSALADLGVGIVVDDYGTGACSLAHLAQSPASVIKIDKSFVFGMNDDEMDARSCAAIVALAKALGRQTIAEGVETEKQAAMLANQGCDFLQGFLTCEPGSRDDILDLLERGERFE